MKNTKYSTLIAAGALALSLSGGGGEAWAQNPEELLLAARQNFGLATARSASMGGAFVSLGADPLSLSLNPAGLAMYSRNEFSFTPGLKIGATHTDYYDPYERIGTTRQNTLTNLSSVAVIFADRTGADQNNSFAVGFGMNRLADFNRGSRAVGFAEEWSIADLFAAQLMQGEMDAQTLKTAHNPFFTYPTSLWGAIMGYQAELVDPLVDDQRRYATSGVLSSGVMIFPTHELKTQGRVNEYALSGAFNFGSVLYIGATLGIQDLMYNRYDTYTEITYMPDESKNVGLDNLTYRQYLTVKGVGLNVKLGVTARPVDWLRIGVAYHSPTWLAVDELYGADLTVWDFRYIDPGYSDTPNERLSGRMRTPSRLMAGLSATIGRVGIVSVDYERTWYNRMKYRNREDLNAGMWTDYRPVDAFRAGIELQPIRSFFVRGGFGWSSSPYRGTTFGRYTQYSGGLGYRNRGFSIDLAYVYGKTTQLPEKLFSLAGVTSDPVTGAEVAEPYTLEPYGTVQTEQRNHHAVLTVGIRFCSLTCSGRKGF